MVKSSNKINFKNEFFKKNNNKKRWANLKDEKKYKRDIIEKAYQFYKLFNIENIIIK